MGNETAIHVSSLRKVFKVHRKEPGLWGSVKALVHRRYDNVEAVKGLSFDLARGELVGFLGPNGAGKTTTLKMLSGLLYPSSGEATVLGFTPHKREYPFLRSISLVMGQKNQLWWDLPAWDGFLLNQEIYQLDREKTKKRIDSLAEWLEVKDQLKIQVRKLSLGERMKMELIAALLHEPNIVFLDEPTIGLDVTAQRKIRNFIREYNRDSGATILLTSHYMADIAELCKRVIVIGNGQLLYDGDLTGVIERFSDEKLVGADFPMDGMPPREELERLGTVTTYEPPRLRMRVKRDGVSAAVSHLVTRYTPEDLSVDEV
ncbi:MAG: ATP-binding cassette domain-containing protein, partial [Planctomycetes bacterium]|nr:ATP-binding cassette domain-containing protein [Planctomycetota bacterium]